MALSDVSALSIAAELLRYLLAERRFLLAERRRLLTRALRAESMARWKSAEHPTRRFL